MTNQLSTVRQSQQDRHSPISRQNNHNQYEAMKAAWCRAHPKASPAEYQAAMKRIAKLAGV